MNIMSHRLITKITFFLMIFCCFVKESEALDWSEDQRLQVNAAGDVVAIWQTYEAVSGKYLIQSSYYDATLASWTAPIVISDPLTNSFSPEFTMNAGGDAVAIWVSDDFSGTIGVFASVYLASTGAFQTVPTQVSDINDIIILNDYRVSLNDAGDIVVSWSAFIDTTYTAAIRAVIGNVSGVWSSPSTLSI